MNNSVNIIFGFLLIINSTALFAQQDPLAGKDTLILENERIEDVIESDKPYLRPPYQKIIQGSPEQMNYQSKEFYVETDFEPAPPKIKPAEEGKKEDLSNNFIKLGLGRFMTPLGQIYLNKGRDRNVDYGLDFTHYSSHKDNIPLRKFRQDYGNIRLDLIEKDYSLKTRLNVYNTTYFNYADTVFSSSDTLAAQREDSLRNGFTRVKASVNLATNYNPSADYEYDLGLDIGYMGGNRGNNEFLLGLKPSGAYYLTDYAKAGINTDFVFARADLSENSQGRIFIDALPHILFDNGDLGVKLGANLNYFNNNSDTLKGNTFVGVVAEASYAIDPDAFTVMAGYTSGMKNNTYQDMLFENPYLARMVDIKPTLEKMNIYIGAKGNLAEQIDFSARLYYKRIENQLIFFTPEQGVYFSAIYDSLMTVFGTHIEVNYDLEENIKAGAALTLNAYETSSIERYYHAAPVRLDLFGSYTWNDQLTADAEIFIFGPRAMSLAETGDLITQGPFVDVNLGADYRITRGFSVYLAINNLLNTNYQRWHNYPERKIEFSGGITLSF